MVALRRLCHSFLLIGQVWINHHTMFRLLKEADGGVVLLNLLLLLDVGFLPFPTVVLAGSVVAAKGVSAAAVLYGATLAVGGLFFNGIWRWASRRDLLVNVVTDEQARSIGRRFLLGPVLYSVATIVAAGLPAAALGAFGILILFFLTPGRTHREIAVTSSTPTVDAST